MAVGSGWLPAELTRSQPYSMGPLLRCQPGTMPCTSPNRVMVMPAAGTNLRIDNPDIFIKAAFVAPAHIQRQAQRAGERAIIMSYPKGLREALGLVEPVAPEVADVVPEPSPAAAVLGVGQSFIDALRALDDEDED